MIFEEVKLKNPGVLLYRLPDELLQILRKEIVKIDSYTDSQKKLFQANKALVGQIEHEYFIKCPDAARQFIMQAALEFTEYFDFRKKSSLSLDKFWVNFQSQYEYNPIHNHTSDLSFVIWIDIPYDLQEEDKLGNSKNAAEKKNGRFHLLYQTAFNGISTMQIDLDKSYEGCMIMFPGTAHHAVYPYYTTSKKRISLAGNIQTK